MGVLGIALREGIVVMLAISLILVGGVRGPLLTYRICFGLSVTCPAGAKGSWLLTLGI